MSKPMKVVLAIEVPDLGGRIATAVRKDGRSVQVISTAAEISDATLYNLMKEKYGQVSIETVRRLERVLGTSLDVNFPVAA
jgi:lambda repressor-like predicted transcriptional regulator